MSKKQIRVEPEKINLQGIRILKAHYEEDDECALNPQDVIGFSVGLKSEGGFNLDENYHRFRLFVKIVGQDEELNNLGLSAEYHIEFDYVIDNMMDFVDLDEKTSEFSVSKMLGATIAGISYSTARGIILDRTQATDLNGVILPVINPHSLLDLDTFTEVEDKTISKKTK
jgi:hypothetical protein